MENFVALLLMVMPGFFVRKVKEEVRSVKEIKSDTEKTIISLVYSVPVLILNLIILVYIFKHSELGELFLLFKSLRFVLKYAVLTLFTTTIISLILIFVEYKVKLKIINWIRKKLGESEKTNSLTPWEDFFKEKGETPVKILKGERISAQGFVKHWDLDGTRDKDIVLEYVEIMTENPQCFTRIKRQYIDYKNDLVIQEYYFDEDRLLNNNDSSNVS